MTVQLNLTTIEARIKRVGRAKIEVDLIKNTHARGTGFMRDYNRKLGEEGE